MAHCGAVVQQGLASAQLVKTAGLGQVPISSFQRRGDAVRRLIPIAGQILTVRVQVDEPGRHH